MKTADTIVIGLGAMGSAAAYQLARAGQSVIGIDRFVPPHSNGSSHGETRITRQAIGEGGAYVPLVLRSHEIWRDIESETGQSLLLACGALIISPEQGGGLHHGKPDFLAQTIASARQFGIPHDVLDAAGIAARYPQLQLQGDEAGYFEPGGGLVFPERCIAAQLELARRLRADIRTDERVLGFASSAAGVRVTTDRETFEAKHVVLTAGGWNRELAGTPFASLALQRQTLHWFEPDRPEQYHFERFPVFIWIHGPGAEDLFYGFPIPPQGHGVKVATETTLCVSGSPDAIDRTVAPAESQALFEGHVAGRLRGMRPDRLRAEACFYTVTPDRDFIIDHHPDEPRLLLVSACSGHGFKHSAAIGEAVAGLVTEAGGTLDLAAFGLARLG